MNSEIKYYTPDELINIALESAINVEGLIDIDRSSFFITNKFEGIIKSTVSKIPLYMALYLEGQNKAKIEIPTFFHSEILEDLLEKEKSQEDLTELPDIHFFELSRLLKIKDPKVTQIGTLRISKLVKGLHYITGKSFFISNLTHWEFCMIKEFIIQSMTLGDSFNK